MSKPLQVLNDFPLESQIEGSFTTVSINPAGLMITQRGEEDEDNAIAIVLMKDQAVELVRLCQGRIVGALTNTHIKLVADIDQTLGDLREYEGTIEAMCEAGTKGIKPYMKMKGASLLLYAMATLTNLYLKDTAVHLQEPPEEPYEKP